MPPEPGAKADLAGLFERIPQVDAVRRSRWPGLRSWGVRHWVAWAASSVVLFFLYGGLGAVNVGGTPGTPTGPWTLLVAALAGAGGFMLATYLPGAGQRAGLSACGVLQLVLVLLMPWLLSPAPPVQAALGLALLIALGVQRARGVGCAV